jgi:RNA polymerase sigma factor (sigma-70 family)
MNQRSLQAVLRYLQHVTGPDHGAQDDQQLLERIQEGRDEEAFAALVQRHAALVLGVCRRVLHHEQDAEDAFQATFLVLARHASAIRRHESLANWLYKVAYRLALRLRAQTARRAAAELEEEPARPATAADDLSWREVRVVLDEELQRLPEKYRAPLVLCYLSGKTRDEAAEELGWSVGAVKGCLERGRQMLRALLERRGLTLSVALLGILLTHEEAAGAASAALIAATTGSGLAFASGTAVGIVPAHVLHLAESGLCSGALSYLKLTLALSLLLSFVTLGAVLGMRTVPPMVGPTSSLPVSFAEEELEEPGPAFRNITQECGLAAILEDRYAENPKWWLSGLHLVDLDGDGHLDVFLSVHGKGGALAALNDGKGRFKLAAGDWPGSEIHLAYDLDEDGKVDLTMTHQDGGGKWWLNRSQPGTLHFDQTKIERTTNTARRQAMIDLNRDGRVDWIRGVPNVLNFDLADGKGGFTAGAATLPVGDTARAEVLCLPVDLNGDGHIDFLVEWGHYGGKPTSRIYLNDGKMNFRDATRECGLDGTDLAIKGVADVNQDGSPDLLVLEGLKPEVYLNDGKGKFTKKPGAITGMEKATRPSHGSWGMAVMTDFDNDGIPDLIWNGRHFLWLLRGTGGGSFEYVNRDWGIKDLSAASVDDGLCFGDIDGDGRLDVLGYTSNGEGRQVAVYRNTLPVQNWVRVRPIGLPGNKGAAGAKVRVFAAGTRELLWYEQIAIYDSQAAQSYYGFAETERHYGLGRRATVDVEVEFYPSGKKVRAENVKANTTTRVREAP